MRDRSSWTYRKANPKACGTQTRKTIHMPAIKSALLKSFALGALSAGLVAAP